MRWCGNASRTPRNVALEQQPVRVEGRLRRNVVPSFNQPDIFLIVFGLEPRRGLGCSAWPGTAEEREALEADL